jgi:hypothetical protein
VSAVINGTAFLPVDAGRCASSSWRSSGRSRAQHPRHQRERARHLRIFTVGRGVVLNLIVLGFMNMDPQQPTVILGSATSVINDIATTASRTRSRS